MIISFHFLKQAFITSGAFIYTLCFLNLSPAFSKDSLTSRPCFLTNVNRFIAFYCLLPHHFPTFSYCFKEDIWHSFSSFEEESASKLLMHFIPFWASFLGGINYLKLIVASFCKQVAKSALFWFVQSAEGKESSIYWQIIQLTDAVGRNLIDKSCDVKLASALTSAGFCHSLRSTMCIFLCTVGTSCWNSISVRSHAFLFSSWSLVCNFQHFYMNIGKVGRMC